MASPAPFTETARPNLGYTSDDDDAQARGGRRNQALAQPAPSSSSSTSQPAGQLLKGAIDEHGNQKSAALMVGIKLDLEAEIHLTARVKGDIAIGLY